MRAWPRVLSRSVTSDSVGGAACSTETPSACWSRVVICGDRCRRDSATPQASHSMVGAVVAGTSGTKASDMRYSVTHDVYL